MKFNFTIKSFVAVALMAAIASCKPNLKDVTPTQGEADFSRYIAVGNSLTAGYADGGLYLEGQKNSYPEMLAAQMKSMGGGSFTTPFFNEDQANGSEYLEFRGFSATGSPTLVPVTSNLAITGALANKTPSYTRYEGEEINNYGVPGIKLKHAQVPGYGQANGFFRRILPAAQADAANYLDFVTAKPFTFFSLWLGNNDILLYASHGAVVVGDDSPTDKTIFAKIYSDVVGRLTSNGAKGVVATIPDVVSTPYFTTLTLTSLKAAVGGAEIWVKPGVGNARPATAEDLFVLTLSSANLIGKPNAAGAPYGVHPLNPIGNEYVLDKAEQIQVTDYVNAYNSTIKKVAAEKGLAIMDANAMLKQFATPQMINGASVSSAYISGNLFSLDGIHLTPMGYAIAANGFIKAINEKYGSNLSIVDASKYRGVRFPAGVTPATVASK
jgi:phospholipase/lecithinase/hemolysin